MLDKISISVVSDVSNTSYLGVNNLLPKIFSQIENAMNGYEKILTWTGDPSVNVAIKNAREGYKIDNYYLFFDFTTSSSSITRIIYVSKENSVTNAYNISYNSKACIKDSSNHYSFTFNFIHLRNKEFDCFCLDDLSSFLFYCILSNNIHYCGKFASNVFTLDDNSSLLKYLYNEILVDDNSVYFLDVEDKFIAPVYLSDTTTGPIDIEVIVETLLHSSVDNVVNSYFNINNINYVAIGTKILIVY